MKHRDVDPRTQLIAEAASHGVRLLAGQADQLLEYLQWLLRANEVHNLTAITSERDAISLHLVDSLTAVKEVSESPIGVALDLGTGGGLPGVPICIVTGREFHLMDATRKKTESLALYLKSAGLRASAINGRAEEPPPALLDGYSCVVARAVAPLPSLVELATPLLKHGGTLVCMKGDPSEDEVARGDSAAVICGLDPFSVRRFKLEGGQDRSVFVYRKVRQSSIHLPRAAGRAQKRPLA